MNVRLGTPIVVATLAFVLVNCSSSSTYAQGGNAITIDTPSATPPATPTIPTSGSFGTGGYYRLLPAKVIISSSIFSLSKTVHRQAIL